MDGWPARISLHLAQFASQDLGEYGRYEVRQFLSDRREKEWRVRPRP
jgi:hypothetical protein